MPATEQDNIQLPIRNGKELQPLEAAQEFLSNEANGEFVRLLEETLLEPDATRQALRLIEQKRDHLSNLAGLTGAAGIVSGAFLTPVGFLLLALIYKPLIRVTKLGRIIKVMKLLLKEFEGMGIQIYPCLKVPGHNPLDLFVIFPERVYLLISIRSKSKEEALIVYNETNETLYTKHKNRPMPNRKWLPCPLVELSDYQAWLGKNRTLFGISGNALRKYSLIKTLILCKPVHLAQHNEHLYAKMGGISFLALRRKGTIFVVEEEQIIDFVKACLIETASAKTAK